jgi:hypothetical protein
VTCRRACTADRLSFSFDTGAYHCKCWTRRDTEGRAGWEARAWEFRALQNGRLVRHTLAQNSGQDGGVGRRGDAPPPIPASVLLNHVQLATTAKSRHLWCCRRGQRSGRIVLHCLQQFPDTAVNALGVALQNRSDRVFPCGPPCYCRLHWNTRFRRDFLPLSSRTNKMTLIQATADKCSVCLQSHAARY